MNTLLAKQQGKPINLNFIRMYWEQVCDYKICIALKQWFSQICLTMNYTMFVTDARSCTCNTPTEDCAF